MDSLLATRRRNRKVCRNPARLLCLVLIPVVLLGCSNEPYRYVQVSGTLKFDDDTVLEGESVSLIFKPQVEPIDGKTFPKEGIAYVDENGVFSAVTSHKFEDGIVAGEHRVLVIATGEDGQSLVPTEYTDEKTTPLVVSTNDPQPFEFRVPKR